MNTTNVLGVDFFSAGIVAAVEQGMQAMARREAAYVAAPDSEMMLAARRNRRLFRAIREAELVLPAGSGVIYSSYILGMPIQRRITTMDYASALMARMSESGKSVFILGGGEEAARLAGERILSRYPGIRLAGSDRGGYETDEELLAAVNAAEPDLVLVCFGTPGQELWMNRSRGELKAGLLLGYGRELELLAGLAPQVPQKWRDGGFEWMYKMLREPGSFLKVAKRAALLLIALKRRLFG